VVVVQDVGHQEEIVVAAMLVMVVLDQRLVQTQLPILVAVVEVEDQLDLHQLVGMVVLEL
jgi:hypothetical protein